MILTIPRLLAQAKMIEPISGEKHHGRCYICMETVDELVDIKRVVSGNFTGFQHLKAGHGLCVFCAGALKEATVRKTNWVVSPARFKAFKFNEFRDVLTEALARNEPFAIFVTKSFKKHGWIVNPFAINTPSNEGSINRFVVIFEEDVARFTPRSYEKITGLVDALMPFFGKKRLETLETNSSIIETLVEVGAIQHYYEAKKFAGNPAWELVVKCTDTPKKLTTMKTLRKDTKKPEKQSKKRKKEEEGEVYGAEIYF